MLNWRSTLYSATASDRSLIIFSMPHSLSLTILQLGGRVPTYILPITRELPNECTIKLPCIWRPNTWQWCFQVHKVESLKKAQSVTLQLLVLNMFFWCWDSATLAWNKQGLTIVLIAAFPATYYLLIFPCLYPLLSFINYDSLTSVLLLTLPNGVFLCKAMSRPVSYPHNFLRYQV